MEQSKEPQPVAAGEVFKKRFPNLPSSIEPYLEDILLCMEDYHSLASSEISTLQNTIEEQKKEIENHVNKLRELQGLIERYRKIEEYDSNKCSNHVYNEIMEHLAKHNL